MTFDRPLALVLLAALPLIWWLHRRRSGAPLVRVASLLAFRGAGEVVPSSAPQRAFDATLALLLSAAAALALAAAEPRLGSRRADALYVIVDDSVSMTSRTCDAVARAASALSDAAPAAVREDHALVAGAAAGRGADGLPGSLQAHLEAARGRGFPGIVLVTDAAIEPMPGVAVIGPSQSSMTNLAVWAAALDGDDAVVSVRNFADHTIGATLRSDGRDYAVAVGPQSVTTVRIAAPERGARARYEIADPPDDLAADDRLGVERRGGVRRIRFEREVPCPRIEAALHAAGAEVVPGGDAEVFVRYAMPWTAAVAAHPTLVIAPRPAGPEASTPGPHLVGAGTESLRGDAVIGAGDGAVVLPAPGTTLIARLRVAGAIGTTWSDATGTIAFAGPGLVVQSADPEDPLSDWHRDPSFAAWIAVALDHLGGGPDRLVPIGPVPAAESDVVHAPPATSAPERIREVVRRGEADEDPVRLGAWCAGAASALLAAATVAMIRRS